MKAVNGHAKYMPHGGPPFSSTSNIWLPSDFAGDLLDTPLAYRADWDLDLDGAGTNATV